ncbi:MAG: dienelactone hydrolase family protein [Thermoplasmata archaeon]|nr:dienelactone hydrolase family protein [Thermoplasmata archaeon]MCI4362494.1 dienelactone hydrolase family protein [Thermoplasmata archaeon]
MRDDDLLLKTPGLEFGSGVIGPCDICGKRQAVIVLQKERFQLCVIDFLNKTWTGSKATPGSPLPPYRSERVTFPTDAVPSGEAAGVLLTPTRQVRRPVVLITPEVYGITTSLLDAAIHFARAGFEVLIPDVGKTSLFGPTDHLTSRLKLRTSGGVPVTTPRVAKLVRFYADALNYLRTRDMVNADKSAVFGLSFGGALALAVAGLDQRLTAVALAYPVPVTPADALTLVTAKVFVVAGRRDRVANASRAQLEKLPGGQVEFDWLTEVGHNYLSRDLRAYDQNRAEQSWADLVAFLKRQLMPPPPKPPTPPTKSPAAVLPPAATAVAKPAAPPATARAAAPA